MRSWRCIRLCLRHSVGHSRWVTPEEPPHSVWSPLWVFSHPSAHLSWMWLHPSDVCCILGKGGGGTVDFAIYPSSFKMFLEERIREKWENGFGDKPRKQDQHKIKVENNGTVGKACCWVFNVLIDQPLHQDNAEQRIIVFSRAFVSVDHYVYQTSTGKTIWKQNAFVNRDFNPDLFHPTYIEADQVLFLLSAFVPRGSRPLTWSCS